MKKLRWILLITLSTLLVAGCKIRIVVPNGGGVITVSDLVDCKAGQSCDVDVVDIFFDESFVAVPNDGFIFIGWKKAGRHFCGNKREPCDLFTSEFGGNDTLMGFLNSDEVFFLAPQFANLNNVLRGTWRGEWHNETFGSRGDMTTMIERQSNGSITITNDVDGNVFGGSNPPPVTVNIMPNADGRFSYDAIHTIQGVEARVVAELDANGILTFEIPELPLPGFDSYIASGPVTRNTIMMDYTVNFTTGSPAVGTIQLKRE